MLIVNISQECVSWRLQLLNKSYCHRSKRRERERGRCGKSIPFDEVIVEFVVRDSGVTSVYQRQSYLLSCLKSFVLRSPLFPLRFSVNLLVLLYCAICTQPQHHRLTMCHSHIRFVFSSLGIGSIRKQTQIDLPLVSCTDGLGTRISDDCHANSTHEVRTEPLSSILAWRGITSSWVLWSTFGLWTHLVWGLLGSIFVTEEQIYWRNKDDYSVPLSVMARELSTIFSQSNPWLQEVSHAFLVHSFLQFLLIVIVPLICSFCFPRNTL